MNILFLALYPPVPPVDGGRIRTYNILKQAARNNEITLVCLDDPLSHPEDRRLLSTICKDVFVLSKPDLSERNWVDKIADLRRIKPVGLKRWVSKENKRLLQDYLKDKEFELVHLDHILLAEYAPSAIRLPRLLTHHNIETQVLKRDLANASGRGLIDSFAKRIEIYRWRNYEVAESRKANAVVVVSILEAQYFSRFIPEERVFVVPNGVDLEFFQIQDRQLDEPILLYTGSMNYPPNVDAMLWFCGEIWPEIIRKVPQAKLMIVGRSPTGEITRLGNQNGISVTGTVEDVRPFYRKSSVFIVPLRSGGGTRLKILEAMAMGVPVVSTSIGCEGLDLVIGQDLLLADDVEGFAYRVLQLLGDPAQNKAMGMNGRKRVESKYSWEVSAENLESAYQYTVCSTSQVH